MEEVKRHPVFQRLDWDALAARSLPAPWVPPRVLRDCAGGMEKGVIAKTEDVFKGDQVMGEVSLHSLCFDRRFTVTFSFSS